MRTLVALAMLGCTAETGSDGISTARSGEVLPDFTLDDVNPTSPTSGEPVSVADQRGRVSAWYFGHST